ncbi:MAG: hypothetical protein IKV66_04455 [Clostridia bacterium]|nr:hypothetical protein [Clostridia bacterium]
MRFVDTRKYVSMLRELVREGNEVSMLITGSSMSPFLLSHKDTICFKAPWRALRRGDMVFYERSTGQFVMHRIYKVHKNGLYIVGDAQKDIEGPVDPSQVFALITKVNRRGKWVGPGDFWWEFYEHIWIHLVRFRPLIFSLYHRIMRK